MPDFLNAFYELDTWMQVYWGCAIVGTTIFAVQMVLTMVGMDGTDMDMDFDSGTMDLGGSISLLASRTSSISWSDSAGQVSVSQAS